LKESLRAQGNGLDVSIDTDKGELTVTMSKEAFEKIFKVVAPTFTLKSDLLRLSVELKAIQEVKPLIIKGASPFILSHVFEKDLDDFVKIIREQTIGKKVTKRNIHRFLLEYFTDYIAQYLSEIINMVHNFINNITIIKDIDWKTIRDPQKLTKQDRLMPDASNFVPFLYTMTPSPPFRAGFNFGGLGCYLLLGGYWFYTIGCYYVAQYFSWYWYFVTYSPCNVPCRV